MKWIIGCLIGVGVILGFNKMSLAAELSISEELYAAAHLQQTKPALVMVGTIDTEGFPQTRVMSNLRYHEHSASKLLEDTDFTTYAVTRADTEKLQHLAKNSKMSMYYQSEGQGLLLMGTGEVVTDPMIRHAIWDEVFKQMGYTDANDPMLVVLRFTPTHGKFYYQQKQNKLLFTPSVQ